MNYLLKIFTKEWKKSKTTEEKFDTLYKEIGRLRQEIEICKKNNNQNIWESL